MPYRLVVATGLLLFVCGASAAADTVRLKNGRTVEGQVVRTDESSVVVVVKGQPEFFAPTEVESIHYSSMRIVAPRAGPSGVGSGSASVGFDSSMLDELKRRAAVLPHAFTQLQSAQAKWHRGVRLAALKEARDAVQSLLPLHGGAIRLLSVLADLCLVFLVRLPLLWMILWMLSAQPDLARVAKWVFLAYAMKLLLLVALMLSCDYAGTTGLVMAGIATLSAGGGMLLLAVRTLDIGVGRAAVALTLAAVLNVALDVLLVNSIATSIIPR